MSVQSPISNDESLLNDGERLDDLQVEGFKIIQKPGAFMFGTDAVLLSDFVMLKSNSKIIDLGTGTGIIALLLAAHNPGISVDAVELNPVMAEMAARSVLLNNACDSVRVHNIDLRGAALTLGRGVYDAVVCNPPYFEGGSALKPKNEIRTQAKLLNDLTLSDVCLSAFELLKTGGRFSVVFPAQRLNDLMTAMELSRLAPKRIRTVHYNINKPPRLILLDAVKEGGRQLEWLPPLILKNIDGTDSAEWKRIYG